MSKLDELLAQLCPNGVDYKSLSEFANISRGGNFQKKHFVSEGIPCIHYGQIYTKYGLFTEQTLSFIDDETAKKQKFAEPNDIVMAVTSENIEDVCKCVAWLGKQRVAVSGHSAIIHHNQNAKYLTYWLHSAMFQSQKRKLAHGTKVIEVTPDTLNSVIVPIPPLDVQAEIVRILDNFTELTAELTAELTVREQQFEYYRNFLLTKENGQRVALSEVVKEKNSGATPKKSIKAYYENGTIPWIRTQDIHFNQITEVNSYITEKAVRETAVKWIPKNCVMVAISGASAGRCAVNKIEATTNQHCLNMQIDAEKALYKYVFYCVSNCYTELLSKKQGARGDLNSSLILSVEIPLPSLERQKLIVDMLDSFDYLQKDIKNGLPAEIEARQKQYEYYRDILLTFPELKQ